MAAPSSVRASTLEREPALEGLMRRAITIPVVLLLFTAGLATAPLWISIGLVIDVASRGRRSALRCFTFLFWYLACEAGGLLVIALLLAARLRGRAAFLDANAALQKAWARALFLGARLTFGIRLEVEDGEALDHGPVLVLIRHATVVDTLVPTLAAEVPYGLRLRYVLKSELLWDPCLDIVGNRMGHYFARRGSGDTDGEVARVARLAEGLGESDGVLIYPEGTRFTEAKRARILERLAERGEEGRLARARRLRHVLPPKVEGTLGLLDAARDADVVVCAHTGLEATTSFWDLWTGAAVGQVLRVRCWRTPRSEIPTLPSACGAWIDDQWQRVDDWIDANRDAPETSPARQVAR